MNLEAAGCRLFQCILKAGNYMMGYRTPECLEGPGKIKELGLFLNGKGINDVFVVTGEGMMKRGQVNPMLDGFDQAGIRYTVQTYTATDPTTDDVEIGVQMYLKHGCKAIVAMGGGSRIDCAKAIAARIAQPKKSVIELQGLLRVHKAIVPFVAIPTTAGAGSETTVAAVITDAKTHRKASINDPVLIPKYAVLDPELTVGLPPFTSAATGMDALVHAVEAYTNQMYNTKLENQLAKEAVKLIVENIHLVCEDGANLVARQNMQRAAFYAGRAFTRGCVGYVHAIGHTLGGLYGISHGHAMAVLLPRVMRQYGSAVHKSLAELADACGMKGSSDAEKSKEFIVWIEKTNQQLGLNDPFDVIEEKDVDLMAGWAHQEANPLYPVPVVWTKKELREFIGNLKKTG